MLGENNNWKKTDVAKHFSLDDFERSTVYDTIERYKVDLSVEDRSTSGPLSSFNKIKTKHLRNSTKNCINVIQRKLGTEFITKTYRFPW